MKNFIVYKSSAGSGKTYNLAVNYISLSIGNGFFKRDYFKKILAITFTNKAAKEMKERILHYLYSLSQQQDIDNVLYEIKLKTQLSEKLIFKFSKELYSYIIHNYSDLGIQTIDKFTYKIVKSFSRDLGVSNEFELVLDSQKIIQPVVANLLNKISDQNKFFSEVMVDFTLKKIDDGNSYNIEADLEDFCRHFFIEGSEGKLIKNNFSINESKKIKDELFEKQNVIKESINLLQKDVLKFFLDNNLTPDHFLRGTYYNLFSIKLNSRNYKDWIPSNSLLKNIENDIWYKKNIDEDLKNSIENLKDHLINFIDELMKLLKEYITCNAVLNKIYPTIIISELFNHIKTYKRENNIEHISSFNRKIHNIVTSQVSSFIFERLGERYNHFLIDEFQDTSILQWQNLLPLISDTLDIGKSIVVGDGKQSIYRWRSGEVEQFLKLPEIFKGSHLDFHSEWYAKLSNHYKQENLLENFRSKKNIIDFNNNFFSHAKNILSEDLKLIYDNSVQQSSFAKDGGYVSIELFDDDIYQENMLHKIVEEIKEIISERKFNYNDIAILCNTHKEIEIIADKLSKNSIPMVSDEGLLISNSQNVKLIVSTLKYLQNHNDDIIKASILTNLYKVKSLDFTLNELYLKIKEEKQFVNLLEDLGYKLTIADLDELSLFEMVNKVIDSFKIKRDVFVDFFLDFAHNFSLNKTNNISTFLENWFEIKSKKSIEISEEINAVRLMTIHKSKGLAFSIVLLPFNWKSSPKKEMWVKNPTSISNKLKYSLISQNKNLLISDFSKQYEKELSLITLDNLNKLYVACTRAKESLYIYSISSKRSSINNFNMNSFFSSYSESYPYIIGEKDVNSNLNQKKENIFLKKDIENQNWRNKLIINNSSSDFWDIENPQKKKDWGKLLHYTLSKIYFKDQVFEIINDVYQKGLCDLSEKNKLEKVITDLFTDPNIVYFFSKDWKVKTEKEILLSSGKTYIPDRIQFRDNQVVIIDYKTGKKEDHHKEQIVKYSTVLKDMGYANISLYLIYTSQTKKVCKV